MLSNPERLKKWDRIHTRGLTYGRATVQRAIDGTTTTYNQQHGRGRKAPTRNGRPLAPLAVMTARKSPIVLVNSPKPLAELQSALKGKVYQIGGVSGKGNQASAKISHSLVRREWLARPLL